MAQCVFIDQHQPPMEIIMTTFKSVLSLSTFAALIAIPLMISGAQASTTGKLLACQANSKQGVVDCCERILRTNKRPLWMIGGGSSCNSAAVCRGGSSSGGEKLSAAFVAAPKRCGIYIPQQETPSKDRPESNEGGQNQRSAKD
jgi:hypothetical protein